jgi:hypothetical protein
MANKRKSKRSKRQSRETMLASPARARALDAISRMRTEKLSLSKAARRAETSVKSIIKYAGSALKKNARGRYQATRSDKLTRVINFQTEGGTIELVTNSSRTASEVSHYMTAVKIFLEKGDASRLAEFRDKAIRANGASYFYITDLDLLERLQDADVSFDVYAKLN